MYNRNALSIQEKEREMKKLFLFAAVLLVASMILVGCKPAATPETTTTTSEETTTTTTTEETTTKAPGDWNIVMVTPYGAVPYWQQIEAGMNAANADFGTNVQYIGPSDLDLNAQLQAIDTAIASKVDGIITNGYVPESFTPLFQKATDAGIPVVLVDADDPESTRTTYIGTSNEAAGYQAGQAMAECMNGSGKIGILTGVIGSSNIDDRVTGFNRALAEYPDMEVVTMEVTNVDLQTANEKAGAMLTAYPDITGLYGTTEPDIIGAAQVVAERGATGLCLVGFDDATQTLDYIRQGVIYATIVQKPYMMGYMGVQVMLDILNGKEVQEIYDTGVTTVTSANVDTYKNP
jgi:ribose transport system substrate-binding protein